MRRRDASIYSQLYLQLGYLGREHILLVKSICQKIFTYLRRSRLDKTSVRVSMTMPIPAAPCARPFATTGARRDHNISQSLIISQLHPCSRYSESVCLLTYELWISCPQKFLDVPEHSVQHPSFPHSELSLLGQKIDVPTL